MSRRRTHNPDFMATVDMEEISGCKTIDELANDHIINHIQVSQPPLPAKLSPLHFDHQGGLMEQNNAALQRGRQG